MAHQQPDDPEWAINVQPILAALCEYPFVVDALYVQQMAAVHTHFCYLQEGTHIICTPWDGKIISLMSGLQHQGEAYLMPT